MIRNRKRIPAVSARNATKAKHARPFMMRAGCMNLLRLSRILHDFLSFSERLPGQLSF